ncbi:MRG-domain-containing protein [Cystobasidium minutum MCA 4210]|uniref:MRG-domain-containing protein n=1 Tax=Cystobasidium minutum MCA 4210 TaxID=1397322 RepID=UPI0034CFC210|eukprot:jgi/Rhomi1/164938/fgenesh1_kg.1_\
MQQQNFTDNEKALCYHGPLIYEAIMKAETWTDPKKHQGQTGPHYFVHYKGWKQTWDEWVPETRLLKWEDANIKLQKSLIEAQRAKDRAEKEAAKLAAAAAASASTSHDGSSSSLPKSLSSARASGSHAAKDGSNAASGLNSAGAARGTKRGRDSLAFDEDEYKSKPEIKIVIPDLLKVKLVDDWEAITKNYQLVPLPRTPSVKDILSDYESSQTSSSSSGSSRHVSRSASLTHEIVSGLKLYFEKSIGNNLLYRFERGQYGEIKKKYQGPNVPEEEKKEMIEVYGVEHLLRLFVNLPELIAHTAMDTDTIAVLRDSLQDIMKFIVQEQDRYFNVKYQETSSAYQNLSRI